MNLQFNHLRGRIPDFLGNLSSLEIVSLSDNPFGGNIPDSFGRLKKLKTLALGGNNLSGTVPPSVYNRSLLGIFILSQNQLHGNLPSNFGLTLPSLNYFHLSINFFGGSIPKSLSNASKLEFFEVYGNNFSGKVSVDFGGMKHLGNLNVGYNNLGSGEVDEMSFMNSLANCSDLWSLNLAGNNFRAALPDSIANLSIQLRRLALTENQFFGNIPSGIGNLVNIYLLGMEIKPICRENSRRNG